MSGDRSRWLALLERVLLGALIAAAVGVASHWALRIIETRRLSTAPLSFGSVAELDHFTSPTWMTALLAALIVATALLLVRRTDLASPRALIAAVVLALLPIAAVATSIFGFYVVLLAAVLIPTFLVGLHLPLPADDLAPAPPRDRRDTIFAAALWLLAALVHAIFSMHRYWSFGAGSWDLGCMIHNFYRASHFLDSTSTVLGDVDYLGDHFMVGIYLYAPIMWISSSGYALLLVQALNMGAAAPAIYLIARDKGAARLPAIALALAAGFAFGIQSAMYFDSHEIAVGFGFLCFALWAFESERYRMATVLLFLFALFKESLGAYVAAIGLLAVWRGLRSGSRPAIRAGIGWVLMGAVWFVLVNRVFMPALIARASPPEPHETFGDFGPTVFSALRGILTHPMKAIGAVFIPSGDKVQSQLVTLAGTGYLALAAPEITIAALPLIAERFLSSKSTMWEMGYHYAAPLCLYAAWAAAAGWARIESATAAALGWIGGASIARSRRLILALYLFASVALINSVGYRHPANYHEWGHDYFSTPERRRANAHAVAALEAEGSGARLAVQNRILPHLANRPVIYRLGDWPKADFVLLSIGENAWPWDDGFPARLADQLGKSAEWKRTFSEGGTSIFARVKGAAPTPTAPNGTKTATPAAANPVDPRPGDR